MCSVVPNWIIFVAWSISVILLLISHWWNREQWLLFQLGIVYLDIPVDLTAVNVQAYFSPYWVEFLLLTSTFNFVYTWHSSKHVWCLNLPTSCSATIRILIKILVDLCIAVPKMGQTQGIGTYRYKGGVTTNIYSNNASLHIFSIINSFS